jgi:hypothetical protein
VWWLINFTPRPLYPRGMTRYPLYRRLGGLQGRFGRVLKISSPTGIRSQDCPARSESLYRLSYRGPQIQQVRQRKKIKTNGYYIWGFAVVNIKITVLWFVTPCTLVNYWQFISNLLPLSSVYLEDGGSKTIYLPDPRHCSIQGVVTNV